MNDMVLFLLIVAALIFVGLFIWSRMEKKRSEGQNVSLSQESKDIYGKLRSVIPSKSTAAPKVSLIHSDDAKPETVTAVETTNAQASSEGVTQPVKEVSTQEQSGFVVEAVSEVEEKKTEKPTEVVKPVADEKIPSFNDFIATQPTVEEAKTTESQTIDFNKTEASKQAAFDLAEPVKEEKKPAAEPEEVVVPQKAEFPKEGMVNYEFDDLTQSVGMIHLLNPLPGQAMVDMAANLKKLNLPIEIYVRSTDTKRWYKPRPEGTYNEMAVVLLLATRKSCINEMDASRFCVAIQQAGIALDADSDSEPAQEIVNRAKRLYNAITNLDVQLSIILASRNVIPTQELSEAALMAGFTQLNPTRYFLGNARQIGEATIFLRVTDYDRHQLALVLDAPLAIPNSKPLHRLFSVANDLCCRLTLEMQDTNGQPINSEAAQAIHNQLSKYYQQMIRAEIQPGSARARTLFSRDN